MVVFATAVPEVVAQPIVSPQNCLEILLPSLSTYILLVFDK